MSEPLPVFRYHPDPVATGSIEASDAMCHCCSRQRGWVYAGPVYAPEELKRGLCPWCIADGSAAERFAATFTDDWALAGRVAPAVLFAITTRTPGFSSWQAECWQLHCGDGAAFLGAVGRRELEALPDALAALRRECESSGRTADTTATYLAALDPEGPPTAYLFACLHCGVQLAYSDTT